MEFEYTKTRNTSNSASSASAMAQLGSNSPSSGYSMGKRNPGAESSLGKELTVAATHVKEAEDYHFTATRENFQHVIISGFVPIARCIDGK